ncbi:Type 1 glutamine amidotransferase-like domain-containing protein [Agrococcus sp. 1P02AA]|uniref:Type 1 glutamine amidotransferase-like domain-containing protein n=1 Tax=Agrococcus sp. 1P02AA TaxID=3132259 RepID=UPI0039A6C51E
MRLLLTSMGVTNASIADALVDLLGKPIAESSALIIPTAAHPFPGGAGMVWEAVAGRAPGPLAELGWKSLGVLELTALPTIRPESWVPAVRDADALLVWGGDVLYLCHWLRQSGLADLLPSLDATVYVGVSAGSIALAARNPDAAFDLQFVPDGSAMAEEADQTLGLVDFALFPHLVPDGTPGATLSAIQRWADGIPSPTYAIDDATAITVVDGEVRVVSEGDWHLLQP